jgi:serine protease Do
LLGDNPAYLGVRPIDSPAGVKISTISELGSADQAGLKAGDIIANVDGEKIVSTTQLVNKIRQLSPGDKMVIEYIRDGKKSETVAKLNGRTLSGDIPSPPAQKSTQFGAIISKRSKGFPLVFQHDTPLLPEHCGGPICDLDGNVVGINIARHGRVGSYAIPANHIKKIAELLLRRDVANRSTDDQKKK